MTIPTKSIVWEIFKFFYFLFINVFMLSIIMQLDILVKLKS